MAASTVSSSPLHAKLSNLSFTPSPLPLPTHYSSKPFNPLKLKLNTHFPNSHLLLSPPHFHAAFAAFDSFEVAQDDNITAQDDPQSEGEDWEQEEEYEELKPIDSNEGGRLYVGNLPYAMTSSQLTEVFQEAGRVINVEV